MRSSGKPGGLGIPIVIAIAALAAMLLPPTSAAEAVTDPELALFDPASGQWHLRYADGSTDDFFYGNPGDTPLTGDWNCNGLDTIAMYRESAGFMYLRNSNDFGVADTSYFFGAPGDIPIAGDWNGNDCDTVSIYRPSEGKVYVINSLGTAVAELSYYFGQPGDRPFAGDFNGNGTDTLGLYRQSTGFVYFTNDTPVNNGVASTANSFFYGAPGDRILSGDWNWDGADSVGIFRPSTQSFYLSFENVQGVADLVIPFGQASWLPTAGTFSAPAPILTFGNGIHVVGVDVQPGTYRAASFSGFCYWERKSGFGGTLGEIIANSFGDISQVVTIEPTDAGFESDDCGTWTSDLSPITFGPWAPFDDGVYIVGTDADIAPGTWRSGPVTDFCYWERKGGFSGTLDDVEANSFSSIRQIVTIQPADVGFETDGCGQWTRDLSPITPGVTSPFGDGVYFVGVGMDIAAGTWSSRGDFTGFCYWERMSGFSGNLSDVITNDFTDLTPTVTIGPGDAGFTSDGCGTWDFVG